MMLYLPFPSQVVTESPLKKNTLEDMYFKITSRTAKLRVQFHLMHFHAKIVNSNKAI